MKIKIYSRFDSTKIIYEGEAENIRELVVRAVKDNANLRNADLENADLRSANLYNANLYNADLENANLRNANLYNANLRNANLYNADLENADLRSANLENANLRNADLYNANLYNADLENANLRNADLYNANLRNANLEKCKTPPIESHRFISEILFRRAESVKHRQWAGLVRISLDWCWDDFFEQMPKSAIRWAGEILCNLWPNAFNEKFGR